MHWPALFTRAEHLAITGSQMLMAMCERLWSCTYPHAVLSDNLSGPASSSRLMFQHVGLNSMQAVHRQLAGLGSPPATLAITCLTSRRRLSLQALMAKHKAAVRLEEQARACEYDALFAFDSLRPQLLEHMPVLDESRYARTFAPAAAVDMSAEPAAVQVCSPPAAGSAGQPYCTVLCKDSFCGPHPPLCAPAGQLR